jgi:hypothetical protein
MESKWVVRQARRYGAGLALVVCFEGAMPPLAAAEVATAENTVAPAKDGAVTAEGDDRRTLRRLPANLGRGAMGLFNHDNVGPAVAGGAAAAVSSLWDDDVREDLVKSPSQLDWGSTLETAGGPVYSTAFVAGMFVGGRFSHGRFRAATYDMLDASIVNLAYTEVLKVAVGRERPNGEDNKSFPSGHTSNAFALAAVAERHYGWKIGVPAYLIAGVVGVSRLHEDKHWLSDVLAGGTVGYLVGRTVVRVNNRPLDHPGGHTTWNVSPIVARQARGLQVSILF